MTRRSSKSNAEQYLYIAFRLREDTQQNAVSQRLDDVFARVFPDQYAKVFASAEQQEIVFRLTRPVFELPGEQQEFFSLLEYLFNMTATHLPHFTQYQEVVEP